MVCNLNQVTFQRFGTVVSEQSRGQAPAEKSKVSLRKLSGPEGVVCRAKSDTWITPGAGMSVLSVSRDGVRYRHFCLDKPVCIRKGTLFALSAFQGKAAATVSAAEEPDQTEKTISHCLQPEDTVRVDRIHTFFYNVKEDGFLFSGESHPLTELTYLDKGTLHSVVDGRDLVLKQGDLVVCGPDQWHMQYADIGVAPRFVTISFALSGLDLTPLLNRRFTASQPVVTAIGAMLREQEQPDRYSDDVILAQLKLLMLQLMRESAPSKAGKLQNSGTLHPENEIICHAQQYISSHVREKLSVPLVARQVDVSPSYLTALFHKNLQIAPGEYIRRIKLQESKRMIREKDLNFTEIAAELQYSTVHHFSRQFKEKFGITPTEYAKSVR